MNIVKVTTKEQLDELYHDSALSWEGISEESFPRIFDWVKDHTTLKNETLHVIKGSLMNSIYNLTGDNAYNSDLNIVSIKLSDIDDWQKLIIPRFQVGGRWFDDIVDNNARRESDKCHT